MSTLARCHAEIDGAMTVSKVEALLVDFPPDDTPRAVELDLASCNFIPPGPGWRLGNAMSRWAASGRVSVAVPSPGDFSGSWFHAFTKSGLGLAIAQYAAEVTLADGSEITESVRDYYGNGGLRSGQNYAVATDLPSTQLVAGIDAFDEGLAAMARHVGLLYGQLERSARGALRVSCFEAIENVLDHAFKSPCEVDPDAALSYFSLSFHANVNAARSPSADFPDYLADLPSHLPDDRDRSGLSRRLSSIRGAEFRRDKGRIPISTAALGRLRRRPLLRL